MGILRGIRPGRHERLETLTPLLEVLELVEAGAGRTEEHLVTGLRQGKRDTHGTAEGRHHVMGKVSQIPRELGNGLAQEDQPSKLACQGLPQWGIAGALVGAAEQQHKRPGKGANGR